MGLLVASAVMLAAHRLLQLAVPSPSSSTSSAASVRQLARRTTACGGSLLAAGLAITFLRGRGYVASSSASTSMSASEREAELQGLWAGAYEGWKHVPGDSSENDTIFTRPAAAAAASTADAAAATAATAAAAVRAAATAAAAGSPAAPAAAAAARVATKAANAAAAASSTAPIAFPPIVTSSRLFAVGPGRYCLPHHPSHFEPSFIELDGIL